MGATMRIVGRRLISYRESKLNCPLRARGTRYRKGYAHGGRLRLTTPSRVPWRVAKGPLPGTYYQLATKGWPRLAEGRVPYHFLQLPLGVRFDICRDGGPDPRAARTGGCRLRMVTYRVPASLGHCAACSARLSYFLLGR